MQIWTNYKTHISKSGGTYSQTPVAKLVPSCGGAGGSGKQGSVISVGDASNDSSYRSWVKIRWDAGCINDYRRGHEGSIDIKCATPGKGEMYYAAHLPKLGKTKQPNMRVLADRANGRACATALHPSVVCLSVVCDVCVLWLNGASYRKSARRSKWEMVMGIEW